MFKKNLPDENMPLTQRESLKNKIAELTASGLNSNEIEKYLSKISKAQLIRIIKDYQEGSFRPEGEKVVSMDDVTKMLTRINDAFKSAQESVAKQRNLALEEVKEALAGNGTDVVCEILTKHFNLIEINS